MEKNIPDFSKEILSGSTLLLTGPVAHIEEELYKSANKAISNPKIKNVIWICYQQAPQDVAELLNNCGAAVESINKIHYIDMLSYMLGLQQKLENTANCSSPTEYNCLLRSIDFLKIKDGSGLIIFDNLNALMSYDIIERMIRFIRNLNNLVSGNKTAIIYLGISGGSSQEIEVSIEATMDKVYYLQNYVVRSSPAVPFEQFKKTTWTDVFTLNAPLMFLLLVIMVISNIVLLVTLFFLILQ